MHPDITRALTDYRIEMLTREMRNARRAGRHLRYPFRRAS
ncbi:MAG: hypothetical protein JWN00_2009 [Actinomycetia bacterium]|nr:hypothetical protein [Actinomycetes bacterium]